MLAFMRLDIQKRNVHRLFNAIELGTVEKVVVRSSVAQASEAVVAVVDDNGTYHAEGGRQGQDMSRDSVPSLALAWWVTETVPSALHAQDSTVP
jgi:hypothetical protein